MRLRIGGALLLAVALVALIVALVQQQSDPADVATARPQTPAGVAVVAGPASGFPPALRDTRPVVTATQRTVDLCGVGKVTLDTVGTVFPAQVQREATQTLKRLAEAMAADRDLATRMVGVSLEARLKATAAA